MGAKPVVPESEILVAGRALAADGRPVTGWALRGAIGRGDPDRLFSVWQSRPAEASVGGEAEATPVAAVVLPPVVAEAVDAMRERVGGLAVDLWRAAERLAAERGQGEAEAARADAAALRQELDQAAVALRGADDAREAAEERAQEMAVRAEAMAAEAAAVRANAAQRGAVAEALLVEARAEAERLRADLRAALDAVGRAGQGAGA